MLPYYAERFPTVEINYTFYRAPNEKILAGLEHGHARSLQADAEGAEAHHARRAAARLRRPRPPVPRDGVGARPEARRAAVPAAAESEEGPGAVRRVSRHVSAARVRRLRVPARVVADEEVYDRLRARNLALCVADSEKLSTPVEMTADYALLPAARRGLHAGRYRAVGRVMYERTAQCREDVFVYFKHEESGKGPEFARALMRALSIDER